VWLRDGSKVEVTKHTGGKGYTISLFNGMGKTI
jgi:hypothetical protein